MSVVKIREQPDSLDLEHLTELADDAGYRRVLARIRETRVTIARELERAATWDEARIAQGKLEGIDLALGMAPQLAREIRDRLKKAPR
jgi:hypothetical protein